ncbi:hypothetical protein F5888DRAFT_1892163 [Russula emetica]|nr:hypothetical protein F5888DRAFT_1892163 [Russula emetica]
MLNLIQRTTWNYRKFTPVRAKREGRTEEKAIRHQTEVRVIWASTIISSYIIVGVHEIQASSIPQQQGNPSRLKQSPSSQRVPAIEELANHGSLAEWGCQLKAGDVEAHSEVANLVQDVREGDDSDCASDRDQRSDPEKKPVHAVQDNRQPENVSAASRRASLEECQCIREDKEFLASGEQTALAYDDCCSVTPRITKAIKAMIRVDQLKPIRTTIATNELTPPQPEDCCQERDGDHNGRGMVFVEVGGLAFEITDGGVFIFKKF